jgi:hypothetical protein
MREFIKPMFIKLASNKPPVFVEKNDKPFVYYGEKNDYPDYLIDLYRKSPFHSSIIDGKVRHICGKGWIIDTKGVDLLSRAQMEYWIKDVNKKENLDEFTKKITNDLELFDGIAIEVIWKNNGELAEANHVPFQYVRSNADNTEFYYTSKWFKPSGSRMVANGQAEDEEDYTVYKPYDFENRKGKQLFYYKCYTSGLGTYPLPNYLQAITAIETEIRIENYNLNLIRNGFSASHIINFYNGAPPTKEEREKFRKDIEAQLSSDDNAGSFILNFADGKDRGSEVIAIPTTDEGKYKQLKDSVQQSILTRHGIPNPAMLGIKTEGQLGNRKELEDALIAFQNNYITPRQQIIEYIVNEIFADKGYEGKLRIKQLENFNLEITSELIKEVMPKEMLQEIIAEKLGIDLKKYSKAIKQNVVQTKVEMRQIPVECLEVFEHFGVTRDEVETLSEREFEFKSFEETEKSEEEFLLEYASFATKKKTIGGIGTGGKLPAVPKSEIITMYSYAGPADSKNRPFCSKMLSLNRLYTRKDMQLINAEIAKTEEYREAFGDLSINVWEHRGGWYRKPGTDVSVPQCRHFWKQELVIKK